MTNSFSSSRLTLLDVTLRDGGYRNQFHFDPAVSRRLVKDLTAADVDYIEVGYRNGLANRSISVGPTGQCEDTFLADLRDHCPQAKLGVMIHPQNINEGDLHALKELGVSLIRVCLTAPTMEQNIETINACKAWGFTTTANIIKVSTLDLKTVLSRVEVLDGSDADVIYIADSFGNLIPDVVSEYIQGMRSITSKTLGFHAHNNLSMALANALAAIAHGAEFIDASICGMGFGIGNLPMEILAGYLERAGQGDRVDVLKILQLADFFAKEVPHSNKPIQALDIFWGLNHLSSHFRKPVLEVAEQENLSPFTVAKMVAQADGIRPNAAEIKQLLRSELLQPQLD